MTWRLVAAALACAALALAACGGGSNDASGYTDVDEVDAIIEAVLAQDSSALIAKVALRQFPCTTEDGVLGSPPCAAGETEGTVIDALPLAQCTTHFTRQYELDRAFEFNDTVELYAVYGSDGEYAAVFSMAPEPGANPFGVTVGIDHGSITYIDYGCGQTAAQLVQNVDAEDFLITPAPEATPTP
jgi:hypothetical protein